MRRSLAGRVILLTRDGGLADDVRSLGAEVRVAAVTRYEPIRTSVDPSRFDWIVFTSPRAVAYCGFPLENARNVACVGPGTARAVEERGGRVLVVPPEHNAGSLVRALLDREPMAGCRVLFPCSEIALPTVEEELGRAGARVSRVPVYRTLPAESLAPDVTEGVEVVVFLAPSAVEAWFHLGGDLGGVTALALGETTAGALRARGIVPVVAGSSDRAGLLAALEGL